MSLIEVVSVIAMFTVLTDFVTRRNDGAKGNTNHGAPIYR